MSDQSKPLPIRTDQDAHDKVQVKIVDALDPTRQVEITANREIRVTSTSADVGAIMSLLSSSNFMKLSNFDKIVPSFSGVTTTFQYFESGALVGEARMRFVSSTDWDLEVEAYINEDNGTPLLDDDDTTLFLD